MKKGIVLLAIIVTAIFRVNAQENKVDLFIEPLSEQEAYDIKGGGGCSPGDMVFTIKSDIQLLSFDSNVIDISSVSYDEDKGEYVFCHSKESFWLTVSSPNHISKKTYIDGQNSKYAFRIVEKTATGTIYLKTTPNNALIDFGFSGQSPQLSSYPIEMNAGEYKIRISKNGYQSVDTTIIVPSDGSTRQMEVSLKPLFGRIHLDISSSDKAQFQIFPVIDIDTAHVNLADLHIKEKLHSFDAPENVQYFKLYEGGYVPLPVGSYNVTVNSPGFKTYNTQVLSNKGGTTPLVVKMVPIIGYLTVIDEGNALGANVVLDGDTIGKVPLFKYPVRIGNHRVKILKPGFLSNIEEYSFEAQENLEHDLTVSMSVFKEYFVHTTPSIAEVLVNGRRLGFTPLKISLTEGVHEVVIRKSGSLDVRKVVRVDGRGENKLDTLKIALEKTIPLIVASEREGLRMMVKRNEEVIYRDLLTPSEVLLPQGEYKIELYEEKSKCFSGIINYTTQEEIILPCYSIGTFTALVGDFFLASPKALNEDGGNHYNLMGIGSYGRLNVFPGFSTSILKGAFFKENKQEHEQEIIIPTDHRANAKHTNFMPAASIILLNGELRLGGSILRELDVAVLGAYTYYPTLGLLGEQTWGVNHVSGHEVFVGLEISSRISAFNFNLKIGQESFKGNYNFSYEKKFDKYAYHVVPFTLGQFGIKAGFTLGQKPSKGNNMIRLWHKPFVANY